MKKKTPEFEYKECLSCGICAQTCPVSALSMTRPGRSGKYKNIFPELTGEGCIGCGQCAAGCPMGCISMKEEE